MKMGLCDAQYISTIRSLLNLQPLTSQYPRQCQNLLGQHLGIFQQDFWDLDLVILLLLLQQPRLPRVALSLLQHQYPLRDHSAPTASEMPPPATAPANQNSETARRPRRYPRLNPELDRVCAIKSPPGSRRSSVSKLSRGGQD